jgi:GLPGLI family protein
MKHRAARRVVTLGIMLGLAAAAYSQGLYIESKVTGPMGERTTQTYAMPKKIKSVTNKDGEAVIVRLDKELFISIDPSEKTYSEMTFAEMESMMKKAGSQMDDKMAEMQKRLADMPEEQRKMVEQMMGNKMSGMNKDAKVEVNSTDENKNINGFSCTKYVVTTDGNESMTIWATKDVKGFNEMKSDWQEFSRRMMSMSPMRGKGMADAMQKVDGFPIQMEIGANMTTTVTRVERRSTPDNEFEIPSGYKKVKPKMMERESKEDSNE